MTSRLALHLRASFLLLTGFALALPMGCGSTQGGGGTFQVTLKGDPPFSLGSRAKARITLWGYDGNIADQTATPLEIVTPTVDRVPMAVTMSLPPDAERRISPNSGEKTRACYYVTLVVDVDGDGQICEGDLRVDFDRVKQEQTCSVDLMTKEFFLQKVPAGTPCAPVTSF